MPIAAPTIDPQFGDHAVIQRGKPVVLRGTATPSEPLTVTFAGESRGRLPARMAGGEAAFPAHSAGGPFTITASGADGSASSADVAIGDVWLCSGQSNMEYPVRRALNSDGEVQNAGDSDLRLMKVPQQIADCRRGVSRKCRAGKPTSPDSAQDFSAACYFMARELRTSEKVPIGAIDDSWGATPVREWMDEASVRAGGEGALVDLMQLRRTNPAQALRAFGDVWGEWWRSKTDDAPGQEPWHASDRLAWKAVPEISYWDAWAPEWKAFDGAMWFRRRVTLTAAEAAQGATLSLGVFDDMDQTWVNGAPVGGTNDWSAERYYALPAGVLRPGENEVLVYVRDNWGPGGMAGPAEKVRLALCRREARSRSATAGNIRSSTMRSARRRPRRGAKSPGVSMIYNAMIAPLGPLGLKGVAWYQGEADVGEPGYDRRLAAWMRNWRTQFRDPQLPFLIVGSRRLGNAAIAAEGERLGGADQRATAGGEPRSADGAGQRHRPWRAGRHPSAEQAGGRAAAGARRAHRSPMDQAGRSVRCRSARTRSGNSVVVKFTKPLQVISGSRPIGFELCGDRAAASPMRA